MLFSLLPPGILFTAAHHLVQEIFLKREQNILQAKNLAQLCR